MPAAFEAPLPRGLATQTPRPDRVWPNANRQPGAQEAMRRSRAPVAQTWSSWPLLVRPGATEIRTKRATPKQAGGSRTHGHAHRSQWREPLATRPNPRWRTGRSNDSGDTEDVPCL
jgi:hypothetical protein